MAWDVVDIPYTLKGLGDFERKSVTYGHVTLFWLTGSWFHFLRFTLDRYNAADPLFLSSIIQSRKRFYRNAGSAIPLRGSSSPFRLRAGCPLSQPFVIGIAVLCRADSGLSINALLYSRPICQSSSKMISPTPVLDCTDHSTITITPSPTPFHPLRNPAFTIPASSLAHLETAARHLHASRTVVFPTETVYGLGASCLDPRGVKRIYEIKNRPNDNPLIIHVSSLDMLDNLLPRPEIYQISRLYLALITAFWPGPLTLLFPSPHPSPPPAPQTIAIRMPAHPLALALIHHSNLPLSAPSANTSGRPSPTQAQHVHNDLNGADGLGCILDGGECGVGVESTVVNALRWKDGGKGSVDILRPGGFGVEDIARIVRDADGGEDVTEILVRGRPWRRDAEASSSKVEHPKPDLPPATPGMKYRHYSPRVPVFLLMPSNTFPRPSIISSGAPSTPRAVLHDIMARIQRNGRKPRLGLLYFENSPLRIRLSGETDILEETFSLGTTAESAAQRLFSGMLRLEGASTAECSAPLGVDVIMIEGCSEQGLGLAVMERIGKAAGGEDRDEAASGLHDEAEGKGGRYWVDIG